ncbi:helix-turn-helix transcriptional regulator [Spectribacter hydrogenoxidans]|uniref:Helix-turn-helix transcriptional regulator n=1 Tax=Spectribacter hydrogenoxidans TaxID=3075608 RepID=A0ABU3BZG6_9GAMM|nr:helix-turn-helix transcriptional regulator [Salinisphaera sp. W335]MDT0634695.1 helix-turn-helix transcriptional regulator [Salinisphaera sp. W335]
MIDQALRRQTDRRQLQQIIASLRDGVILLEPDGRIAWANDAALALHGIREREALGGCCEGYRRRFTLRYRNNREVAPHRYPLDRMVTGERFDNVVVEVTPRHDPDQARTHCVRGLILTDADDDPDCLVLIIEDITDFVSAEQRFERTFAANPAPALICRLSDLLYIKVNAGFTDLTGYTETELLERTVYEIDVLADATDRDLAVARLGAGRTIPQMEACLPRPDGDRQPVVVAGQPMEVGDQSCMLFTFMDLAPRKQAENELRQSEQRFSRAFTLAPVPMFIATRDRLAVMNVNAAFTRTTGYEAADFGDRGLAGIARRPDRGGRPAPLRGEQLVAAAEQEIQLQCRDGTRIDGLLWADTVRIDDRPCVLGAFQDITDRKRSQEELAAAIEAVMADTSWFSRSLIEKLADVRQATEGSGDVRGADSLTEREREILALLADGYGNRDIAARLAISPNTVRNHVANLYAKLDVHSRAGAVIWARERGLRPDPA